MFSLILIALVVVIIGAGLFYAFSSAGNDRKVATQAKREVDTILKPLIIPTHAELPSPAEVQSRPEIRVPIGTTTGKLKARGQINGIGPGKELVLNADLFSRGVVIVGPSGSGKTRACLQPMIGHWLSSDPTSGLFAFADKPNWGNIIRRIAIAMGRDPETIHLVGPGGQNWPLLRNLPPDAVANFVRVAITLDGASDGFFTPSAVNLVRRVASVLSGVTAGGPLIIHESAPHGKVINLDYDLASVSRLCRMNASEMAHYTGDLCSCEHARCNGTRRCATSDRSAFTGS